MNDEFGFGFVVKFFKKEKKKKKKGKIFVFEEFVVDESVMLSLEDFFEVELKFLGFVDV